jgi:hypothetical protein
VVAGADRRAQVNAVEIADDCDPRLLPQGVQIDLLDAFFCEQHFSSLNGNLENAVDVCASHTADLTWDQRSTQWMSAIN